MTYSNAPNNTLDALCTASWLDALEANLTSTLEDANRYHY
jgi:hypothetical protein